jgi:hypothetical protein
MDLGKLVPASLAQCATMLRLVRSIRRGFAVATAAAEYCAAGENGSAWQAHCLAQSHYRTSLAMLLLADDLQPAQIAEIRRQIQSLKAALEKLSLEINDQAASCMIGAPGEENCRASEDVEWD